MNANPSGRVSRRRKNTDNLSDNMSRNKPASAGSGKAPGGSGKAPGAGKKTSDGKGKQSGTETGISGFMKGTKSADEKLSFVINELLEIKQQVSKLDAIQASTDSLTEQLSGVTSRTAELETAVRTNAARLGEVNDQLSTLQTTVKKQEKTVTSMVNLKADIEKSSAKTVKQMNELVDTQGQQVQSFKSSIKMVKDDIMKEVDKKIEKIREEERCRALKKEAFNNRFNLIVVGLPEDENKNALQQAADFFKNSLNVKAIEITSAHRIGNKTEGEGNYARPISVRFKNLAHRNKVWRNRMDITSEDDDKRKIRVFADVPKALREGIQAMYKVVNTASKLDKYKNAKVSDYQVEINDETYQFTELESLPEEIRPSTLAAPRSDKTLAFYTKHSFLSNHFPSNFSIDEFMFNNMEHFLAYQKAILSEDQILIKKAKRATHPLQAKYVLNVLKDCHPDKWSQMVEEVTLEGLRAKFNQNPSLKEYLSNTHNLLLGEASTNPRWGIGLELSDPNVLDHTKWLPDGNLLGRCLMKVREEFKLESAQTKE